MRQAVHSILDQTYRDFELLIIDDGSADAGPEIVTDVADGELYSCERPATEGWPPP